MASHWQRKPLSLQLTQFLRKLIVYREIIMMRVMEVITDKPEWDRKVGSFGA